MQMAGVVDDRLIESLVTGTIIHSLDGDKSVIKCIAYFDTWASVCECLSYKPKTTQ